MKDLDKKLEQIPNELKNYKQWIVFKLSSRDENGKWKNKTPLDPKQNTKLALETEMKNGFAYSNKSWTWGSFEKAVEYLKKIITQNKNKDIAFALGFALGCDSCIGGIDGDHCLNEDGSFNDNAKSIIEKADSYTERSVSGIGFHTLVFSKSDICNRSIVKPGEEGYEVYTPRFKTDDEKKQNLRKKSRNLKH